MSTREEHLWYKKYRPHNIDDVIGENMAAIKQYIGDGVIPDLLLSGLPGTGKSTTAQIILNELCPNKMDRLVIDASTNNGVDVVRSIDTWCRNSPMGSQKIVLLEESDRLTKNAQDALKMIVENTTVSFIFTSNHPERLIKALHSRLTHFEYNELDEDHVILMAANILEKEGITFDDAVFLEHITENSHDLRKLLNSLQLSSSDGELSPPITTGGGSAELEEWQQLWSAGELSKDSLIQEAIQLTIRDPEQVYTIMFENVDRLSDDLVEEGILSIAQHQYESGFIANQNIGLTACIIRIFNQ